RPGATIVFNAGQRALAVLWAGLTWNMIVSHRPSVLLPTVTGQGDVMFPVVGSIFAYMMTTHILVSAFSAARRQMPFLPVLIGNAIIRFAVTAALGMSGLVITLLFLGLSIDLAGVNFVLVPGIVVAILLLMNTAWGQAMRQAAGVHDAMAELLQTLDL